MSSPVALTGARVHTGGDLAEGQAVVIEGGSITAVLPEQDVSPEIHVRRLDGGVLAAGYIDVQVNGGGGVLFNDAPEVDALRTIGAAHRRFGTTGFLATVISDELEVIERAIRAVERGIAEGVPGLLGIHIEGPMLSPQRHGIHQPRFLQGADRALLDLARSLARGRTLVTLAPEVVGPDAIAELVRGGVSVAAGHTDATYDEMRAGFAAGVTGITHLFNAMPALINRSPGPVGAALENSDVYCGVIVDGVHVHPAALRIAMRSRPLDRFMLVSDAMPPVGTDATSFDLHDQQIHVTHDRLVDAKGTLAGANLTMAQAVRNSVEMLDLPVEAALGIAAASPAAFLGIGKQRGTVGPGCAADLVWLDDSLQVRSTWIGGVESEDGER